MFNIGDKLLNFSLMKFGGYDKKIFNLVVVGTKNWYLFVFLVVETFDDHLNNSMVNLFDKMLWRYLFTVEILYIKLFKAHIQKEGLVLPLVERMSTSYSSERANMY